MISITNAPLSAKRRSQRISRNGMSLFQINWELVPENAGQTNIYPYEELMFEMREDYNMFGGRFGSIKRASVITMAHVGWKCATDGWDEFNPDDILLATEIQRLLPLLSRAARVTFEIGNREGGPGQRINNLGLLRCTVSFASERDAKLFRCQ